MKLYRRLNEPITHRLSKSDHIQRIGILVSIFSPIDWVDIPLYSNEVLLCEKAGKFVARCSLFELNERLVEIKRARLSFLGEFLLQSLLKSCKSKGLPEDQKSTFAENSPHYVGHMKQNHGNFTNYSLTKPTQGATLVPKDGAKTCL